MRKLNRLLALLLAVVLVLQMVPGFGGVSAAESTNIIAAQPTADASTIAWAYTEQFASQGGNAPSGAMEVYRDAGYLYIGVKYANADTLSLTIGQKVYTYALDTQEASAVVKVPLGGEGVTFPGYNKSVAISAGLSGTSGIATLTGQLYFCAVATEIIASMPVSHFKNVVGVTVAEEQGCVQLTVDTTAGSDGDFYADTGWYTNVYNDALAAKEQRTKDILVEQTLTVEKLPVSTAATVSGYNSIQGLRIAVRDSGAANQELWLSIHADENGQLSAVMANAKVVELGKRLGDTFRLGL